MRVRLLLTAFVVALTMASGARADIITSWNFSGTFNVGTTHKITAISGHFTLDETANSGGTGLFAISNYSFSFDGGGLIAPGTGSGGWNNVRGVDVSNGTKTIGELFFRNLNGPNLDSLSLFFTSPLESFDGSTFAPTSGNKTSLLFCVDAATFGCGTIETNGITGALFATGSATVVPEPASLAVLSAGLLGYAAVRRRKRRA